MIRKETPSFLGKFDDYVHFLDLLNYLGRLAYIARGVANSNRDVLGYWPSSWDSFVTFELLSEHILKKSYSEAGYLKPQTPFPDDTVFTNHRLLYKRRNLVSALEDKLGTKIVFFEAGCGAGHNVIHAAEYGFDAYGVDIQLPLIELGKEKITELSNKDLISNPHNIHIHHGNFLPKEYAELLKQEKNKGDCRLVVPDILFQNPYEKEGKDVYDKMGLSLDKVTIFYIYPWDVEGRAMEDLFFNYSNSPAFLQEVIGNGFKTIMTNLDGKIDTNWDSNGLLKRRFR